MKKRNEKEALAERIFFLQNKQAQELKLLKEQFHIAYESLKPINLVKSTWREITESPEIKNNLLSNAIGLTTGYLSKKVLMGFSHNPIKKIFGALLQFAIANVVSKHSETIKSAGGDFLHRILNHKSKAMQEFSENEN